MSDIPKIHDKFFKEVFSHKGEMQDLITHTFPKEIVAKLDFDTLVRDETEYINKELEEHFSDIVYNCIYNNQTEVKISFLFEHKNYTEKYIHFQLLTYILNIWQKCTQKDNKKPIIVIPIVFYHGIENWTYQPLTQYFENVDNNLQKFIPSFEYILINTQALSDEKILTEYELETSRIALFLLKYIFDKYQLKQKITNFFATTPNLVNDQQGKDFFVTFYLYLVKQLTPEDMETINEKISRVVPQGNEFVKIFANEQRILEKLESAKKGIRAGLANDIIKLMTDLTDEQIDKIRKELIEEQLLNACNIQGFGTIKQA